MTKLIRLIDLVEGHRFTFATLFGALLLAVVLIAVLARRSVHLLQRKSMTGEQVSTLLAAAIATGVAAQGMWVFFGDNLHLPILLRILFFSFLELMVITSALRARAAQLLGGAVGADGIAMWLLTGLSAVMAATDTANLGTLLIRLSAPLVAAWGWERSMALERHRRAKTPTGINWRITPERLLIKWGLADPTNRTASDVAAQRRLIDVALAADRARTLRDLGSRGRRLDRAVRKLHAAVCALIEDGGLVPEADRDRRQVLVDYIGVLRGTSALIDLDIPNPWIDPAFGKRPGTANVVIEAAEDDTVMRSGAHQPNEAEAEWPVRITEVWTIVAEKFCADDPTRRRNPASVAEILRLRHDEHKTYPEIASVVDGFSQHAVGRVIRQTEKYRHKVFAA